VSKLLREIAEADIDPAVTPVFVEYPAGAPVVVATFWRGLVSGTSYACLHEGLKPTRVFFKAAERREMIALRQTTVGGMQ
jgi:hypothetical protein